MSKTKTSTTNTFWRSEDGTATLIAFSTLIFMLGVAFANLPKNHRDLAIEHQTLSSQQDPTTADSSDVNVGDKDKKVRLKEIATALSPNVFKSWWLKVSDWSQNPLLGFRTSGGAWQWFSFTATGLVLLVVTTLGVWWQRHSVARYIPAFLVVFILTTLSFVLASQQILKYFNLEYPLWALLVGLVIANTVAVPSWLQPAVKPDLYVKIGLILLGAEVLFGKLLILGLPGILVSWTVTPIVLIGTYLFGQKILKIESRSLNMVISADMSVCGVSAAIATASACRAKKEELSLAIALSLVFTVVMMVVQPYCIKWMGLNDVVAGAWLGGTIDSTGAVAAASELLKSPVATEVATTVKMIQNILIGIFAVAIAAYWATFVEQKKRSDAAIKRSAMGEIWRRFPKFALGFLIASLLFSAIQASGVIGNSVVNTVVDGSTKHLRAWFFCLAFVCIGLESNMRQYAFMLRSGKPIVLYVVGQAFNLTLSFIACYVVFQWLFRDATESLLR
jgi:uncharacterized membrane protein YadS